MNALHIAIDPHDDVAATAHQIVDPPGDDQPAAIEHHDVVADVLDIFQQVRRQHDAMPNSRWMRRIRLQHVVAALRVHAVGRLVQEDEFGIVHDGLRQA